MQTMLPHIRQLVLAGEEHTAQSPGTTMAIRILFIPRAALSLAGVRMREYEIKRGHYKNLEGDKLQKLMEECFGPVTNDDGTLVASFGAIKAVRAKLLGKDKVMIDPEMDRSAAGDVVPRTMRVWNDFLERATGFNAKQRSQRLQKAAKAKETATAEGPEADPR